MNIDIKAFLAIISKVIARSGGALIIIGLFFNFVLKSPHSDLVVEMGAFEILLVLLIELARTYIDPKGETYPE